MEHFDTSEVKEIRRDDTNYPHLLRAIKKPPASLRVRGSLPLKMLAAHGYTVVTGLAEGCDRAAFWDGTNELGETVASGLYFYTLTAVDFSATRRMLIRK